MPNKSRSLREVLATTNIGYDRIKIEHPNYGRVKEPQDQTGEQPATSVSKWFKNKFKNT